METFDPRSTASGAQIRSALQLAAEASYPDINPPQSFTDLHGNIHTYTPYPETSAALVMTDRVPLPWEPQETVTMSKEEIALRIDNLKLATQLADLSRKFANMEAATRYGEQCDEDLMEHLSQMQPSTASKDKPFPGNALRHRSQRIGLFTPGQ